MSARNNHVEDMAHALCEANETPWTSLSETCSISLSGALGTKPFWRRLARAAIATARTDDLHAALKLAAIIIETQTPTTIEGTLTEPWDDLLEHINNTLDGKPTKPRL